MHYYRFHADPILENGDPEQPWSVAYCETVLSLLGQACSLISSGWRDYNTNHRGHWIIPLSESTASFCPF